MDEGIFVLTARSAETMELMRFHTIEEFYRRTESFLMERETEHNLILGIAGSMMRNPSLVDFEPYLACVVHEGEVVAAALMNPLNLIPSHIADERAIGLIASDLYAERRTPPGVVSSVPFSRLFVEEWQRLTGQPNRLAMAQRIYKLEQVIPVAKVPGSFRHSDERHRDIIFRWLAAFNAEALGETDTSRLEGQVARYIAPGVTGMYLWEDGGPVSMAASMRPTPNGVVIGGVYTPPELRGRGYASACVAALSQQMLDAGKKWCCLYTDLANPTSNHIYQAIGYEPLRDSAMYRLNNLEEPGR
jgi:predicted GNAT family acetyltransferase